MDANRMTPDELRLLAAKKDVANSLEQAKVQEQMLAALKKQEEDAKIIKRGVLKHDVYGVKEFHLNHAWCITKAERDEILEDVKNKVHLICKKGTKFVCRNPEDECWDAESKELVGCNSIWASKHLKIEDV